VTETAFSSLTENWPPGSDSGTTGGGGPVPGALSVAANRLTGIYTYLHKAKGPTAATNINTLCEFLDAVEAYISDLPSDPKPLQDATDAATEKLTAARLQALTLGFMAGEWEKRSGLKNRPLEDMGKDHAAVLKQQHETASSLKNFVDRLRRLAPLIGEPLPEAHSPSLRRHDRSSGPSDGRPYLLLQQRRIS
jgi:hypothetical protein